MKLRSAGCGVISRNEPRCAITPSIAFKFLKDDSLISMPVNWQLGSRFRIANKFRPLLAPNSVTDLIPLVRAKTRASRPVRFSMRAFRSV